MIIPQSGGSSLAIGATITGATTGLLSVASGLLAQAISGLDYLPPAGNGSQLTGLTEGQIFGLSADLTARLLKANNLSDLANVATARGNLGLGTVATHPDTDFSSVAGAQTITGQKTFALDTLFGGGIFIADGIEKQAGATTRLDINNQLAGGDIRFYSVNTTIFRRPVRIGTTSEILASEVPFILQQRALQSVDMEQVLASDGTTIVTRLNKDGRRIFRQTTAIAGSDLANGEMALSLDATHGAAKFVVTAKDASGTAVTGSFNLT